jgi:ABC-2 type transport system permease protein
MNALVRLRALITKELQALLRDPDGRRLLIAPIIMQLILFPFAATMEVRNVGVVILNEDSGHHATELIQRIAAAPTFSDVRIAHGNAEFTDAINRQRALLGVRFADDFSARIESGQSATVQAVMDGRKSNSAQIALGYVQSIVNAYGDERSGRQFVPLTVRHLYNPNLDNKWFIVPELIAIVTALGFLVVTALSVAREKEQGTLDQLRVSPLTAGQLMIGKAVPAILIATVQGTIILLGALFAYSVPFSGSLLALYVGIIIYGLSSVGCGLLISTVCRTQQQAVLGVFAFLVPGLLLSGFISPVENMPQWLQVLTLANPVRHFVEFVGILYLKGVNMDVFVSSMTPLLLIASVTLSVAYLKFRSASE